MPFKLGEIGLVGEGEEDEENPATDGVMPLYSYASNALGGAIYATGDVTITFSATTTMDDPGFHENESFYSGGAICMAGTSKLEIIDNNLDSITFSDNLAGREVQFAPSAGGFYNPRVTSGDGGAIAFGANTKASIKKCKFMNNRAPHGDGGAVWAELLTDLDGINNSLFEDCVFTSNLDGGAVLAGLLTDLDGINNSLFEDCVFTGNLAGGQALNICNLTSGRGGAFCIVKDSKIDFVRSVFSSNKAYHNGGAICVNANVTSGISDINFTDCSLTANEAFYDVYNLNAGDGGAIYAYNMQGDFINTFIMHNTALRGGGVALQYCYDQIDFTNCKISYNHATASNGTGGGITMILTAPDFSLTEFTENVADGSGGLGGAIYSIYAMDALFAFHALDFQDCLFNYNQAAVSGGAIYTLSSDVTANNCTFVNNDVIYPAGDSGAIYCDTTLVCANSIFDTNTKTQIVVDDLANMTLTDNVFHFEDQDGDPTNLPADQPLYGVRGATGIITGYDLTGLISPPLITGSVYQNIEYEDERNGDYTLPDGSVIAGGYNPPVVPADKTLHVLTPANGVLGYFGANETFSSADKLFQAGTVVRLQARPISGWLIDHWIGTDNDSSTLKDNTVVMNSDRTVGVVFRQPNNIDFPSDQYPTLEQAIEEAQEGDTIVIKPGIYSTHAEPYYIDKAITIQSVDPSVPGLVTFRKENGTQNGASYHCFSFYNCGRDTRLDGITISGFGGTVTPAGDGAGTGEPGGDGGSNYAGGILCSVASPTISNCIIEDCYSQGGNGGNGADGDNTKHGGHGGWAGASFGGGVSCLSSNIRLGKYNRSTSPFTSDPVFINCTFRANRCIGANGGNGGNGVSPLNIGGLGGSYYYTPDRYISYYYSFRTTQDRFTQDEWGNQIFLWPGEWRNGTNYRFRDYTYYAGKGGAVYIDEYCSPEFYNCTFEGNETISGTVGICGTDLSLRPKPGVHYKIDNGGGAVFIYGKSNAKFVDCVFTNNVSDTEIPSYNDDDYAGFGGAIFVKDDSDITIENCTFEGNQSNQGGALYNESASAEISDSTFTGNYATMGAGALVYNSLASDLTGDGVNFLRCIFDSNVAQIPSDLRIDDAQAAEGQEEAEAPSGYGCGGAVYSSKSDTKFYDVEASNNTAEYSGGGFYFACEHSPLIFNGLIVNNNAGASGGGITVIKNAQLTLMNSTIANNGAISAEVDKRYGGGLYCTNDSYADIKDCILWGNSADSLYGKQIAVGTSGQYALHPSRVDVSYCDVQGSSTQIYCDKGLPSTTSDDCIVNYDVATNFDQQPLFVSDDIDTSSYFLSQTAAGQAADSPCLDRGSASDFNIIDEELGLSYYRHTTRTDREFDSGMVDVGYHVVLRSDLDADFDYDFDVDAQDVVRFYMNWLDDGCDFPYWCNDRDINHDGRVNNADYSILNGSVEMDLTKPWPTQMSWAIAPYSTGTTSVSMVAVTAWDNSGCVMDYMFTYGECDPNTTIGSLPLQESPELALTGLVQNKQYWFTVQAFDKAAPQANCNITSERAYVVVGADTSAPLPNPLGWSVAPNAVSQTEITMTAQTATDTSGVQYYFQCVSGGGHDSGWQSSATYTDTGLTLNTTYTYRVCARDLSANLNQGDYSASASATTLDEEGNGGGSTDVTPPTVPVGLSGVQILYNPACYHELTIPYSGSTDASNDVRYKFICKTNSGFSSVIIGKGMYPNDTISNTNGLINTLSIQSEVVKYRVYIGNYLFGNPMEWSVRAYDPSGNYSDSPKITIN